MINWAEKSPDEIISDINSLLNGLSERMDFNPSTLIIPWRRWVMLKRYSMTKRQFRRWRGKQKALRRVIA